MGERRVVITGMGAVTPFGDGIEPYWDGLIDGRSPISGITLFDPTEFDVRFAGECHGFDAEKLLGRKAVKRLDRYAQLAMVAAHEAFEASGLDENWSDPHRVAVVVGSGIGGMNELEQQFARLMTKGPGKVSAFTIPRLMINAASGNISIRYGAKGQSMAVSTACASATNAMGEAYNLIQRGQADVVFTGGAEAAVTELSSAAFASMKALSSRNDDPQHASRPFDRDRDGFVLAEGAGLLIFEELTHAQKRGATILAEVAGFGSSSDAGHLTQPDENGEGAQRAMTAALEHAGVAADQIDYINAHGTATPLGDLAETLAIKRVFGDHVGKLVVSSTKSSVGHSLGASGGTELIASILAMQHGVIPPTINLDNPDPACDLDYCPNVARDCKISVAMSNSFGFGGHNACVIVRRFE